MKCSSDKKRTALPQNNICLQLLRTTHAHVLLLLQTRIIFAPPEVAFKQMRPHVVGADPSKVHEKEIRKCGI